MTAEETPRPGNRGDLEESDATNVHHLQSTSPNSFVQSQKISDRHAGIVESLLRADAEEYRERVGEILYRRSRVAQIVHEADCEDAPLRLFTEDGGWTTGYRCSRCPFEFTWDHPGWPDLVRLGYIERDEFARYFAGIRFPLTPAKIDEIHACWFGDEAVAA